MIKRLYKQLSIFDLFVCKLTELEIINFLRYEDLFNEILGANSSK